MHIIAVSKSAGHHFSKENCDSITLIQGRGVEGDCHFGEKVQHLSRVKVNPDQPNLRQVHLIHAELFDELKQSGYDIPPGALGENITTRGVDLLSLPVGTKIKLGTNAVVELTGLRNPCQQIENFRTGLLSKVVHKSDDGELIRKSGVMAVVTASGVVGTGDLIEVTLPPAPHKKLERV